MPAHRKPPTAIDRLTAYPGLGKRTAAAVLKVARGLTDPHHVLPASSFNYGTGQTDNHLAKLLRHGLAEWVTVGETVRLTDKAHQTIAEPVGV